MIEYGRVIILYVVMAGQAEWSHPSDDSVPWGRNPDPNRVVLGDNATLCPVMGRVVSEQQVGL